MNFEKNLNDRKLGHEWYGWDGNIEAHEGFIEEPKRLFLGIVAFTFGLIFATASLVAWGFYPRLESIHPVLAMIPVAIVLAFAATFAVWFGSVCISILAKTPIKMAEKVGMQMMAMTPFFDFVGKQCGISKDRLGYSLVEIHNELTRIRMKNGSNGRILILSPRCLDREYTDQIKALSGEYDCDFYMAPTGAQARQKVVQVRPAAIIGIACERDLIDGIRDVGYHFPVIGITNKRPIGPCKGAFIEMNELRDAISLFRNRYKIGNGPAEGEESHIPATAPEEPVANTAAEVQQQPVPAGNPAN